MHASAQVKSHGPEFSLKKGITRLGEILKRSKPKYADLGQLGKADAFVERFREIVSDPINLLINRVPEAGYVDEERCVILHNGNRVPIEGRFSYYEEFSDVLIINRGVHEPLEEYCFQTMLSKLSTETPMMLELGAYWAHYSMWLKKAYPQGKCFMVEPDRHNLECGKHNLGINGYSGEFINATVGVSGFQLDAFASQRGISELDILHSDIQGYELEMLQGGRSFLSENRAKYIFVSTHSEPLHHSVIDQLKNYSYRIEVSSGFDTHTTSCDGLVLATSPHVDPLFENFSPLGRIEIAKSSPDRLLEAILSCRVNSVATCPPPNRTAAR